jgi:hypothetical protein
MATLRKGFLASQAQRACRRECYAQAQDRGFSHPHAGALAPSSDSARRADFLHRPDLLADEVDGTRFRLIGVSVSTLCAADGADFADFIDRRAAEAEQAIDRLREKFGNQVVIKGLAFEPEDGEQTQRTDDAPLTSDL